MESDEITWKVVPNTVTNRMVHLSLIHKLIPSRKLGRRNKAMNVAIKQFRGLKRYTDYIRMKTSILRSLSDNDETDDDNSFTEDDYSILYKSNLSLTNYIQEMSNKSKTDSYEAGFLINDDYSMSDAESSKILAGKCKKKSLNDTSLAWQKVVKRKSKDASSSTKETNGITPQMDNQGTTQGETVNACALKNDSGQRNSVVNKTDDETLGNSNEDVPKSVQNNLISSSGNVYDSCINAEVPLNQDHFNRLEKNSNMENTFVDKVKNKKFPNIQSSLSTVSTYQQKDSGIEEDNEEEFSLEIGKRHYKKLKNKSQKIKQNTSNGSFVIKYNGNLTNYDDKFEPENYNIPNESDAKDETLFVNENIITNNERCNDKILKRKPQPKVTHMEIIDKKYKVVPGTSVCNKNVEQEGLSIKDYCDRKHETNEVEQDIADNISLLAKKRLRQLKRLNLTEDSDSSESDDTYSNTENTRGKLFIKRPKKSLDILNTEDENVKFKHKISIQCDKKLQKDENFLEATAHCLNNKVHNTKQYSKTKDSSLDIKRLSFASHDIVQHKSNCLDSAINCNLKEKEHVQGSNKENLKIKSIIQATNEESVICGRPYNLQELVKKENLVLKTAVPSFTFKNMEEDELFIIDVPSTVLEGQLLGHKIHLTEEKLKLGGQKYRVECKDINSTSCVFASEKSHKSYEIVNIKPIIKVVTREKITQTSREKSLNQCNKS